MSRRVAFCVAAVFSLSPLTAFAADTGGSPSEAPVTTAPAPLTLGGATATTVATTVATTKAPASGAKTAAALLAEARISIAAKQYAEAMITLKAAADLDPSDADIQNLLGFSSRNLGDYPAAMKYYGAALKLNPKHTGVLEYQGVAYLLMGQPAKAKANLAALKKICGVKCDQYKDLDKAIKSKKM